MFEKIQEKTQELAKLLSESEDYATYLSAKERAMDNETTRGLIKKYNSLRAKAQANMVLGKEDAEVSEQLRQVTGLLGMNADASAYLIAEYRITTLMAYVYETLNKAIDIDSGLDASE